MKKMRKFNHGEVIGFELSELPQDCKKLTIKNDFYVVGESETHGNDHRVAVLDKATVEFFEKGGVLYMKNFVEAKIYCPNKDRHDDAIIPSGLWEFKKAQEFDYVEMQARQVRD